MTSAVVITEMAKTDKILLKTLDMGHKYYESSFTCRLTTPIDN